MSTSWADLLRSAVRSSGRTTYAIAQESGVPVQTVDRFLAGAEPKLGTAERIARIVGLDLRPSRKRKQAAKLPP